MKFTLLILVVFFQTALLFAGEVIATAVIVKGDAHAFLPNEQKQLLKANDSIYEGMTVSTSDKSFVKLLFIDKSQMSIGPKSEIEVMKFQKNEAGLITLMRGEIRSKVSKDYMQIEDKEKSKLLIQTKSAAMGVRGTDFLVKYNPKNETTALITFEGAVAMVKLSDIMRGNGTLKAKLDTMLNSSAAVMVKRGEYSGTSPKVKRTTYPVKIAPKQFETLKSRDGGIKDNNKTSSSKSNQRSPVPSGIDTKLFSSNNSEEIATSSTDSDAPPPEGGFAKNGSYAPPAGGPVDLETGIYVAPDPTKGSFDPITNTYSLDPATQGSVVNGSYEGPTINGVHYTLKDNGEYEVDEKKTKEEKQSERGPASAAPNQNQKPPELLPSPNEPGFGPTGFPSVPQYPINQPKIISPQSVCEQFPSLPTCKPPASVVIPKSNTRVKFILKTN